MIHLVPVPRHLTVTFLWHQEEKPTSTSSAWNDFHQRRPSSCDSSMYFSVCVSYGGQRADIYLRNSVSLNCLCYRSASAVRCWRGSRETSAGNGAKTTTLNQQSTTTLSYHWVCCCWNRVCVCVKCRWLTEIIIKQTDIKWNILNIQQHTWLSSFSVSVKYKQVQF